MRNDAFSLQRRNSLRHRNDAAQHARRYDAAMTIIGGRCHHSAATLITMLNASGSAFAPSSFRDAPDSVEVAKRSSCEAVHRQPGPAARLIRSSLGTRSGALGVEPAFSPFQYRMIICPFLGHEVHANRACKSSKSRRQERSFGYLSALFPSIFQADITLSPQRKADVAIATRPRFYGHFLPDLSAGQIASALGSSSHAERLIDSYLSHAF